MAIYVPHSKILIAGLSYVRPVAGVSYLQVKVTAEVTMPDVLAVDIITPSEEIVLAFNKTLEDNFGAQDVYVVSVARLFTDSASSIDIIASINTAKALADSVSSTDVLAQLVVKALYDTTAVGDLVTSIGVTKGLSDGVSAPVDLISSIGTNKGLTELVSLADMVDIEYWLEKALADAQSIVDQFGYTLSKPVADSVSSSIDAITTIGTAKGLSESFSLFDMVDIEYAFTKILADMLFSTEIYASSVDKPFTDAQLISDSIASLFYKPFADSTNAPTDVITAIDTAKGLADSTNAPTDVITAIDTAKGLADSQPVSESIAYAYSKPVADSALPLDTIALGPSPVYSDTQAITDAIGLTYLANFTDSIAFTDFVEAVRLYLRDIADSVTVPDAYTDAFIQAPNSDTAGASDSYAASMSKGLSDSAVLIDNMDGDIQYTFVKLVGELLSSADSSLLAFSASKADNVVNSDSGMLMMQDYADITYFLEDYVGTSRTF